MPLTEWITVKVEGFEITGELWIPYGHNWEVTRQPTWHTKSMSEEGTLLPKAAMSLISDFLYDEILEAAKREVTGPENSNYV